MSTPLSLRLDKETQTRLDDFAESIGQSRSGAVRRLIEEGIRMQAHPGILFRDGPAGRRAAIAGGLDVWEIVRTVRNSELRGDAAVAAAAAWLTLPVEQIRRAISYYADFRQEIDEWLAREADAADTAEAAWRRQRDALA